ncbi:hypothetical protein TNCV_1825061 [Trichonephila clavipes]|nr:hypothetical protein TNCV_1825061 [Trichonephila clavipes]
MTSLVSTSPNTSSQHNQSCPIDEQLALTTQLLMSLILSSQPETATHIVIRKGRTTLNALYRLYVMRNYAAFLIIYVSPRHVPSCQVSLRPRSYSRRLVCRRRLQPGLRVNDISRIHRSQHLLTTQSELPN